MTSYRRLLAIGDIHASYTKLNHLLDKVKVDPAQDCVVFLGDYVDRGPKPIQTLEFVHKYVNTKNMVFLRGNHDQMLLDSYLTKKEQKQFCTKPNTYVSDDYSIYWRRNGGSDTESKLEKCSNLNQLLQSLAQTQLYFKTTHNDVEYLFVHAGIRPKIELELQNVFDLLWIRFAFIDEYDGDATVVVGHTVTTTIDSKARKPIVKSNMILVDTGAYLKSGKLSCIDVHTKQVWQT